MEQVSILSEKKSVLKEIALEAKKHIAVTLITAILTALAFSIPFYFNTTYTNKTNTENIQKHEERVTVVEEKISSISTDVKLQGQQLGTVQTDISDIKTNSSKKFDEIDKRFDRIDDRMDKMYDLMLSIEKNTKK